MTANDTMRKDCKINAKNGGKNKYKTRERESSKRAQS